MSLSTGPTSRSFRELGGKMLGVVEDLSQPLFGFLRQNLALAVFVELVLDAVTGTDLVLR